MNVLLVNCVNRITRPPEFFPYGLGILASVIKKQGYFVKLYDCNLHRNTEELRDFLDKNNNWDIVAFSGLITTYTFQMELAALVRNKISDCIIISGGGLATAVPRLIVTKTEIDIACVGEGESIIPKLFNALNSTTPDLSKIPGIVWKEGDNVLSNERPKEIVDLDSIPFPDWELAGLPNYFKYSGFKYKGPQASQLMKRADLTTTRGCPYDCSFCSNVFNRRIIRCRSIDNIIEEIEILHDLYNIDSVDFLDENFCFSRERVFEICDRLIQSNLGISWGTAARVTDVDPELLRCMRAAGCVFILYGFESGSQTILDRMAKGNKIKQSRAAFAMTEEAGIDAHGNMIIGHPGENHNTIRESRDFQKFRMDFLVDHHKHNFSKKYLTDRIEKHFGSVSFCTPYPGSRLYNEYKDMIGDLENFMKLISLNDAREFVINLSDVSDIELLGYQKILSSPNLWNLIN